MVLLDALLRPPGPSVANRADHLGGAALTLSLHWPVRWREVLMLIAIVTSSVLAASEPTLTASPDEDSAPDVSAPAPLPPPAPTSAVTPPSTSSDAPFVLSGAAEAYYAFNFNRPDNGVTDFRGFDNRHNSFTLSNVVLDASWDVADVVGRVAIQVGATPSTYYLAEPALAGGSAANTTGGDLWKFVQQANVGYRFTLLEGLLVQAGLFLSPIGAEGVNVKDNWNYSRSNLFFGLPFYHAGVRATLSVNDALAVTVAGYNGWNNIVDNNDNKSVSASAAWTISDFLVLQGLYFGGVERAKGTPEEGAWRHLFDAYAVITPTKGLGFILHADAGVENNAFGNSGWVAGAVAARVAPWDVMSFAARVDGFYEAAAEDADGSAARIFWPAEWVASATATADFHPADHVSFRLEVRHDQAEGPMFFTGDDVVATAESQDTVTFGVVAWF